MSGKIITDTIEDLLNKIEKYLRDVLSKENLSHNAEKQRKNFVEEIEVIKLYPPLPPLREEKSSLVSTQLKTKTEDSQNDTDIAYDEDLYDDPENSGYTQQEASTYEEPTNFRNRREQVAEAEDSGTDFENEEDEDTDGLRRDSIPLPMKKFFKKGDLPFCELTNVLHTGELSQKAGLFSKGKSTRHFCALCDGRLIVYKSKEEPRPLAQIQLTGCEVVYTDKDGRFDNILKITQGGTEKHWFSAPSRENAGIWLQYLKSVCAGKGPPDKIDVDYLSTIDFTSDEGLGNSLQQSSSSDTTVPSSTEGSGDGVITGTGPQATSNTPTSDKEKTSKASGILDKISKFTLPKKSKVAMQLKDMDGKEIFDCDPDVKISGLAKVKCEKLTGSKSWSKYFCIVKHRCIECYKNLENVKPVICFALHGVKMEPAGLPKRELAIKLTQHDKVFFIQPESRAEHGNWLSVLVKESGCGSPLAKLSPGFEEGDQIYDVVLESSLREQSQVPAHGGSSTNIPPPLPRNPPPMRTPPDVKRPFEGTVAMEDSDEDDDEEDEEEEEEHLVYEKMALSNTTNKKKNQSDNTFKGGYELLVDKGRMSVDNDAVYDDIMHEPDESSTKKMKQVGDLIGRIKENLHKESSYPRQREELRKADTKDTGVIPCATGPTIAEDKELLEKTANPLLSELRKTKSRKTESKDEELDKAVEQISAAKKEIVELRKRRLDIRSEKIKTKLLSEKEVLQSELQEVDSRLEEKQKELTKLQVVAQEHSPSVRTNQGSGGSGSNKNSPNVSRNSSFSSGGRGSPVNSARGSFKTKTSSSNNKASSKSSTLPTITSKVIGDHKMTTSSAGKSSSYTWRSDRSAGLTSVKQPTAESGSKVSVRAEVKKSKEVKAASGSNKSQRSGEGQSKFTKTTSMNNIPNVQERRKMFEIKTAASKS